MNRRTTLLVLLSLPVAAAAHAETPSASSLSSSLKNPLSKMLTSQLGVTEDQASGGIGAYLSLAQEKLGKGDFDQVASLLPGASQYMDKAKELGAVTGPLKNVAGLHSALGKLGIKSETAAKFVPAVTDYLGKAGGSGVADKLTQMLH